MTTTNPPLGLEDNVVRLAEYDERWPLLFTEEKILLESIIGNHTLDIQHIGSTSVPGLAAKPVLDIAIAVESFEGARILIAPMKASGYQYKGENGIPRRHYFVKGMPRTHHVHVFEIASDNWRRHIVFRDHLRANADARLEYEARKRSLLDLGNREGYQEGKSALIERLTRDALRDIE
jgi:GrpB-like predicted nucleotidyltransferase (UPF0157 family)